MKPDSAKHSQLLILYSNFISRYCDLMRTGIPTRRQFFSFLVSIGLIAASPLTLAEHEPDHRYQVTGYVLNEDETPIPSTTVVINANGIGARGITDNNGYFSLRLHLHDPDLGREVHIKTDHGAGTVRATFDPGDRTSARVHYVNIVGGRLIEGQLKAGSKVPVWLYYLFALFVIIVVLSSLGKPIKRLKKRLHPAAKTDHGNRPRPSKAKARSKSKKRKRR